MEHSMPGTPCPPLAPHGQDPRDAAWRAGSTAEDRSPSPPNLGPGAPPQRERRVAPSRWAWLALLVAACGSGPSPGGLLPCAAPSCAPAPVDGGTTDTAAPGDASDAGNPTGPLGDTAAPPDSAGSPDAAPADAGDADGAGSDVVALPCTPGPCCDTATQSVLAKGTPCSESPKQVQWRCFGNAVEQREQHDGCDGLTSQCQAKPDLQVWTPWHTIQTCVGKEKCYPTSATQFKCSATWVGMKCSNGPCCDTAKGQLQPPGTPCGKSIEAVEYGCDGKSVRQRTAQAGCSGQSSQCFVQPANFAWGTWQVSQVCTNGDNCLSTSPAWASCGKPGGPCAGGPCCLGGQLLPAGLPCGDAQLATQSKCVGKEVWQRHGLPGCGAGGQCLSDAAGLAWGPWTLAYACPGGTECKSVQPNEPACISTATVPCGSGPCCDPLTNVWKTKGTPCGTAVMDEQAKCVGAAVWSRKAVAGCSGQASGCSTAAADWAWGPWSELQACPAGQTCKTQFGAAFCSP